MRGITRNNFSTISLGDIVTAVNDVRVDSESDFMKAIDGNVVGDTINISVTRYIEGAPTEVNGDNVSQRYCRKIVSSYPSHPSDCCR